MRITDFLALETQVLPNFPGFTVHNTLLFLQPLHHTIRGFSFEGSGFSKNAFYVWAFFMPLCIPSRHLAFNLGRRVRTVGGGDGWEWGTPTLLERLVPAMSSEAVFLRTLNTTHDVVNALTARVRDPRDLYGEEALAYMSARDGDIARALQLLQSLLETLNPAVRWQNEMLTRGSFLREKLLAGRDEALAQLLSWENQTVRNLHLEQFRHPVSVQND